MRGIERYRAATAIPLPLLLAAVSSLLPQVTQAQAGPRTDTPRAGALRFTFEPVITTWEREFTDSRPEQRMGASLPALGLVHSERRVAPCRLDFGITARLAGR